MGWIACSNLSESRRNESTPTWCLRAAYIALLMFWNQKSGMPLCGAGRSQWKTNKPHPKYTLPVKCEALKYPWILRIFVQPLKSMLVTIVQVHSSALWCWGSDSMGIVMEILNDQNKVEVSNLKVWSSHTSTVIRAWLKPPKEHSDQEIKLHYWKAYGGQPSQLVWVLDVPGTPKTW